MARKTRKKVVRNKKKTKKASPLKALTPAAIIAILLGVAVFAVSVYGIVTTGKFYAWFSSFVGITWVVLVIWIAMVKR